MATITGTENVTLATDSGAIGSLDVNSEGDLTLSNPNRGAKGRALVPGGDNTLVVNYNGDFTGGTMLHGKIIMPNLGAPPAGVATDRVLIGPDGTLYRAD